MSIYVLSKTFFILSETAPLPVVTWQCVFVHNKHISILSTKLQQQILPNSILSQK